MSLFGWNLLYSSVKNDIKSNEDVLLSLTHLVLISNGFQCIGLGDSKNMDGTEAKTETLPKGWNDAYALRYVHQGRLYNLQAKRVDHDLMLNLIRVDERNVSMVQLSSSDVVKREGALDEMIPTNQAVVKQIKEQLIDKVITSTKTKEGASQTTEAGVPAQRESVSSMPAYYQGIPHPLQVPGGGRAGVGVGRMDLDPLGGLMGPGMGGIPGAYPRNPLGPGGGGMLFQPPGQLGPSRQGLPPGALPPGARFDPFRPPDVDRFHQPPRRHPDNDEMPPPGFDDMYM